MTSCPNCGKPVEQRHDVGRPRVYCNETCRTSLVRKRRAERQAAEVERATALLAALRAAAELTPAD